MIQDAELLNIHKKFFCHKRLISSLTSYDLEKKDISAGILIYYCPSPLDSGKYNK